MHTLARTTDPTTSHDAAQFSLDKAPLLQQRIYEILADFPEGLTDDEITDMYELSASLQGWEPVLHDTPRKRRSDLTNRGVVIPTGRRRNHKNVWALA
jgi:hypothetical protein